jgi:hypothetical protein
MSITTTGHICLKPVQYHDLLNVPCHVRYLATDADGDTYGFIGNRPRWNPNTESWFNRSCTPQFIDTHGLSPDVRPECSCLSVNVETQYHNKTVKE